MAYLPIDTALLVERLGIQSSESVAKTNRYRIRPCRAAREKAAFRLGAGRPFGQEINRASG